MEAAGTVFRGDCLSVMATMEANSVDSIVTDPPYGLSFMGNGWDHGVPGASFWEAALRVIKPGGHLLAFGGTRTFHRLMVAIEDAGWEIRDTFMWVYGSGFPKSLDVSKAIDKAAGAKREVVGMSTHKSGIADGNAGPQSRNTDWAWSRGASVAAHYPITAPATDAAKQWDGWGTALKPAWEPIILARKPLEGTVAQNVQKWGVGALNIDGCRVEPTGESRERRGEESQDRRYTETGGTNFAAKPGVRGGAATGRWPANLIHDGSEEVLSLFPTTKSGAHSGEYQRTTSKTKNAYAERAAAPETRAGDEGSAARFYYCAKASQADRNEGLPNGAKNTHPTVKPTALMRYLCRMVTPPGGIVLDPFCGSGSTGKAALLEGFRFAGIDLKAEYVEIAKARLTAEAAE